MNTGADDDSLNTPPFAFSGSSARASPVAAIASRPASISRANPVIQFPPSFVIVESDQLKLKPWQDATAMAVSPLSRLRGRVGGVPDANDDADGSPHPPRS